MEPIRLKEITQLNQSHGDHLVLCFVSFHNLKTYCYLSLKQLALIKQDFVVETMLQVKERPSWYTEKRAVAEKFILNIGLFYLLQKDKEWELAQAKKQLSAFKKLPLAQLLLSDQPEIFHEHKTDYSFKKIGDFRFSDFTQMRPESVASRIWQINRLADLAIFLFGVSNRQTNKLSLEVILKVAEDEIQIDFAFVRFILMVRQFLSAEETVELIQRHREIKKSSFYTQHWDDYVYFGLDRQPLGMISFFTKVQAFSQKKRILLNWNISAHVMKHFDKVMEEAYPKMQPNLDKISDAQYFYNNLSRDYGRLFRPDFPLAHHQNFAHEVKLLDQVVTGNYTLKIPQTYHELVKWGAQLNNCAGNFEQIEHYSKGLLVGVFEQDKIVYLIDYRVKQGRKQITQLKGFKNSLVKSQESLQSILQPFVDNQLIDEDNFSSLADDLK